MTDEIWEEIRRLREELEDLKVKRGILEEHVTQLQGLQEDLQEAQSQVEDMKHEADQALKGTEGGGTDDE